MKHVSGAVLSPLRHLLEQIRRGGNLEERSAGVFYRKRAAFLHFHEDMGLFFADLKIGSEWIRFPVHNAAQETKLLRAVERALKNPSLHEVARAKKTKEKSSR
jgi:hypothetical protein